jgi:hypothetical protein
MRGVSPFRGSTALMELPRAALVASPWLSHCVPLGLFGRGDGLAMGVLCWGLCSRPRCGTVVRPRRPDPLTSARGPIYADVSIRSRPRHVLANVVTLRTGNPGRTGAAAGRRSRSQAETTFGRDFAVGFWAASVCLAIGALNAAGLFPRDGRRLVGAWIGALAWRLSL